MSEFGPVSSPARRPAVWIQFAELLWAGDALVSGSDRFRRRGACAGVRVPSAYAASKRHCDEKRCAADSSGAAPGGTITKIELEFDRPANAWVWKIDSQNDTDQREIKIDTQSANIIADDLDRESSNPVAVDPKKLPPIDALRLATALTPGSVASWALEFDDSRQRYSFDIRTPDGSDNDVDVDVDTRVATRS